MEPHEEEKTKHALLKEENSMLIAANGAYSQQNQMLRTQCAALEEANCVLAAKNDVLKQQNEVLQKEFAGLVKSNLLFKVCGDALNIENRTLKEHNTAHKEEIRLLEEQNTRIMELLEELTNTLESLKEEKPPESKSNDDTICIDVDSFFSKFGIPKEIVLGHAELETPSPRRFIVEISKRFGGSRVAVSITDRDSPRLNMAAEIDRGSLEQAENNQTIYMELASNIAVEACDILELTRGSKAQLSLMDQIYWALTGRHA